MRTTSLLGALVLCALSPFAFAHPHPELEGTEGYDPDPAAYNAEGLLIDELSSEDEEKPRDISASIGFYFNADTGFDEEEGPEGEIGLQEWRFDTPLFGKAAGAFRYSGYLKYRFTELAFTDSFILDDQQLHALSLRIDTLYKPLGKNWYLWGRVSPEVQSDTGSWEEGMGVSGILSYGYDFTEDLSLALGGYYGRSFGGYTFYPSIGLIWDINDRWNLRLIPPDLTATFHMSDDVKFKIGAFPGGGSWNIDPEENGGIDELNYLDIRLAIGVERRLNSKWWISIWAGGNLFQDLELESADGETVFDEQPEDSLFLYLGGKFQL